MTQEPAKRRTNIEKIRSARGEVKTFWADFRDFAFKGDVLDLAIGVIIGAAFNNVVKSLTDDIIMPIFGRLLGNVAFSELYINLSSTPYESLAAANTAGAPVIRYGLFLTNILDFLIIALSLYIVLKFVLRKKREAKEEK